MKRIVKKNEAGNQGGGKCKDASAESIKADILEELFCSQAKFPEVATANDFYQAVSYAVRDRLLHRWINTAHKYFEKKSRTVIYLSAEYLIGPQLGNNLLNLGIHDETSKAIEKLGTSFKEIFDQEEEPGLGNGGLGRLAACYLDSMATLEIPSIGYGIRYEYGIFNQEIRDGWQCEVTDKWLKLGNPWEIANLDVEHRVQFGGKTEAYLDGKGNGRIRWIPDRVLKGVAYDMPVLGYGVNTANLLRLWKAVAVDSFNLGAFNDGDYYHAVEQKVKAENITRVLYPNDSNAFGKELRLQQEYFFVACSLQDMIRIYLQREDKLDGLHKKYAVQLNDTHPAIAVAELMRLLVDEHGMAWDKAWRITRNTFSYTNHTLLSEALEKWPLTMFRSLLPRHTDIIFEINRIFLDEIRRKYPGDEDRVRRLSIIEEGSEKYIRMAYLACVGSNSINGVAGLHTELLQKTVLRDFYELWPKKFSNKTNGVTPRRFMVLCNPGLAKTISKRIGEKWIVDLSQLRKLAKFSSDKLFVREWRSVKQNNKRALAEFIKQTQNIIVDPESMFDVHAKRMHEYKRQHLNVLHVLTLYNRLKRQSRYDGFAPRTFFFGGKAAPGYLTAKLMIKLINAVADLVNNDPDVNDVLKVVFVPEFNVKKAQIIMPAADLSEQISTAGKEASGTGNMKFAMNGALTIGTLDGANIEIRQEVGAENFFLFGMTAEEVIARLTNGYRPREIYESNQDLRDVVDMISSGVLSGGSSELFQPLVQSLLNEDRYMVLADYASYIECQDAVGRAFLDKDAWARMAILNVAGMGKFSSDRSIMEYCRDIWKIEPVHINRCW